MVLILIASTDMLAWVLTIRLSVKLPRPGSQGGALAERGKGKPQGVQRDGHLTPRLPQHHCGGEATPPVGLEGTAWNQRALFLSLKI